MQGEKLFGTDESLESWIGIDVAKRTFDAAIYLPRNRELPFRELSGLPSASFDRSPEGVGSFLRWIDHVGGSFAEREHLGNGPKFRCVMEATGFYSLELARWLVEARSDMRPAIADPKRVNAFGKSLRMRNKTDKTDAALLAMFGTERRPPAYVPMSPEYKELQELVRQRKAIVNMLTSAKFQLAEATFCKEVKRSRKKIVADIERELEKIEKSIRKHVDSHSAVKEKVSLLETIPGVGFLTAATVIAEIGEMSRFATSRKIASYTGLSPRVFESGTSVKRRTRMCKEGQPRIRQLLYLSALVAIREGKNGFSRFYDALVAKGKSKMMAIGAVMRKMICVIRAVCIGGSGYRDELVSPRLA